MWNQTRISAEVSHKQALGSFRGRKANAFERPLCSCKDKESEQREMDPSPSQFPLHELLHHERG